jgi:hypothetical protein
MTLNLELIKKNTDKTIKMCKLPGMVVHTYDSSYMGSIGRRMAIQS